MREPPERRRLGNTELFTSAHSRARRWSAGFCAECPAAMWCKREVEKALAHPSYGLGVEGTWAGVLYRDGRRVTTGRGVVKAAPESDADVLAARAAYKRGERNAWATAGNRAYERRRWAKKGGAA